MAHKKSKYDGSLEKKFYRAMGAIKFFEQRKHYSPGAGKLLESLFGPIQPIVHKKQFLQELNEELMLRAGRLHRYARDSHTERADAPFSVSFNLPAAHAVITNNAHNQAELTQLDGVTREAETIRYEDVRNLPGIEKLLEMTSKAGVGISIGLKSNASQEAHDLRQVFAANSARKGFSMLEEVQITVYPKESFEDGKYPRKLPAEKPVTPAPLKK